MVASVIGGLFTVLWSFKTLRIFEKAKGFRAHAAPQGMCDNLIISLKLLTNQQRDGDSPVESIGTGLLEKSRKGIMDGIRKFIAVDITKQ